MNGVQVIKPYRDIHFDRRILYLEPRLPADAIVLYMNAMDLPEGPRLYVSTLEAQTMFGRDKVRKCLQRLEEVGYAKFSKDRDQNGQVRSLWTIYQFPISDSARISATGSAENAKISAENAKISAVQSGADLQNAKISAENAKISAENAKISAVQSGADLQNAKISAENAKISAESARNSVTFLHTHTYTHTHTHAGAGARAQARAHAPKEDTPERLVGSWAGHYEHDDLGEVDGFAPEVEEWAAMVSNIVKEGYHPLSPVARHQEKANEFRKTAKFLIDEYGSRLSSTGFEEKFKAYWATCGYNPQDKATLGQLASLAEEAVNWVPQNSKEERSNGRSSAKQQQKPIQKLSYLVEDDDGRM